MKVYTVVLVQHCWTNAGWDGFFPQKSFTSREAAEKWIEEKQLEKRRDNSIEYYVEATELQE